jgi:hypothetical protein
MNIVKLLKNLFVIELKRRLRWREIILFLLIVLFFFYFFIDGKNRYMDIIENKTVFQKIDITQQGKSSTETSTENGGDNGKRSDPFH